MSLRRCKLATTHRCVGLGEGGGQGGQTELTHLGSSHEAHLPLCLQGQEPTPLDPAFAERDDKLAEVAALTSALDIAARTRLAPSEPEPEPPAAA
jgi:hypothetical protein